MKQKRLLLLLASSAMAFSFLVPNALKPVEVLEPDNAEYDNQLVVDYDKPVEKYEAPIKRAAASATSIKIHYHNDDGANLPGDNMAGREFWVWCDGVNGSGFQPDAGSTGTDMTLTINFSGEHASFAKKKSISFIVKYKNGWVGQSENLLVKYEDYAPDASGLTEIWCVPGEGNAVEIYKTKAESEMDRFQVATFKDWKKITVICDSVPSYYRLYALTSNYMRMGTDEQKAKLKNYLVGEGTNPSCTDVQYNGKTRKTFEIPLNYTARPNVQYAIEGEFVANPGVVKTKYCSFQNLYETDRFERYYTYNDEYGELGATYNDENSTTFRVWAPTAARVRVFIYDSGTSKELADELKEKGQDVSGSDNYGAYNMAFRPGGIWEVTIKGKDLKNKYYNYYVVNQLGTSETIDPYAKACGVNGDRGMIVNWKETNPEGWDNLPVKWDGDQNLDIKTPNQLSIYETHIRDLTMDETWTGKSMRGTYSAFAESGVTYSKGNKTVKTGYDHLVEMGYNAVHLLPVFDNDNREEVGNRVYNWGYNPKNYNCVEGGFATDPYDGASRITEFKSLVQKFANNENHTRVIMDVVYNHVASAPASSFNKLMPKYYFRYAPDGTYFDGSGCGNEVKTEAPMMSKYIVDSLCWWAKEYKIKGFRFDLMGLVTIGTIDAARKALYEIDPDIIIYGEGWTGDGSGYDYGTRKAYQVHGHQDLADDPDNPNALSKEQRDLLGCVTACVYRYLYPVEKACYVAVFNDGGRNAMRGGNDLNEGWGFIDQGSDHVGGKSGTVADMMIGYHSGFGGNPNQCVNYASCHDNYSLFDQVMNAIESATYDNPGLACAAVSAVECSIMFSNGIAFMQGGEELFRTKEVKSAADKETVRESDTHMIKGKLITHNAYNMSDDVNAFRWDRKISIGQVDTSGYIENIAKAVKLRNQLTKYSKDDLDKNSPYSSQSVFNVWGQGDGKTTIAIRNKGYFCFISGCNDDIIPFGAYYEGTNKVGFTSNKVGDYQGFEPAGEGDSRGIKLGWYTAVCLHG